MRARRSTVVLAGPVALALVLSSCSNRESPVNKRPHTGAGTASVVDGAQQITLTTGVDLRFHPSRITVHQGTVRIILQNKTSPSGGAPHNLQVTGLPAGFVPLTAAGHTSMVTFMAPAPGSYRFICTIHEEQGQTGTLVVKPGAAGRS